MRLVVATRNPGKLREFGVLLSSALPAGTGLVDVSHWPDMPEVVEDGDTFWDNAIKKAVQTSRYTGLTTLADDSGLQVDALGGRPGVHSARYAPEGTDEANNRLLVDELRAVPAKDRTARYVAVLALCIADDELGRELEHRLQADERHHATTAQDGDAEGVLRQHGDRRVVCFRATCEGRIIDEPRGDGGFGYDPYFWVDAFDATMAEVPLDRKNTISHRARAVAKLRDWL